MSVLQIVAVAITVGLNALDGFDVLSISFAAPGIADEWGITRAALGFVLSAELVGMAFGSILLGRVADRFGRRPLMLGCLVVMCSGMYLATVAQGIYDLMVYRVFTGLGIGGMLAAINAVAAEFSNGKRRHLCVSIMAIGYPIGAVIGGTISGFLLDAFGWRVVFYLGATATALFIPLVYFFIPESVHWLARKQPAGALENINRTLKRMGHPTVERLPHIEDDTSLQGLAGDSWLKQFTTRVGGVIFSKRLVATTVLVSAAYFFHITTFYYFVKWIPELVVDMGFEAGSAGFVLVWANAGGAVGGALFGLLTMRYGLKSLTIGVLLLSTVGVTAFGQAPPDFFWLCAVSFFANFCMNAGIVGLYAILAHAFPTYARAQGTGFAIGVGRGGSVLAPIISGFLFAAGMGLGPVSMLMAIGSLVAAVVLLFLKINPADPEANESGGTPQPIAAGAVRPATAAGT